MKIVSTVLGLYNHPTLETSVQKLLHFPFFLLRRKEELSATVSGSRWPEVLRAYFGLSTFSRFHLGESHRSRGKKVSAS